MVSLSYEFTADHNLTFNFINVWTAEDEARRLQGQDTAGLGTVPGESYIDQSILHWTERTLNTYQLKGEHKFKALGDLEFDWVGSLATTTQNEPDHRIFQFFAQPGDPSDPGDDFYLANGSTKPSRPTRIWRDLSENNLFYRGDFKYPLPSYTTKDNFLKAGGFISNSKREFASRTFDVRASNGHPFIGNGDPNSYLATTNLGYIDYYNFPGSYVYSGQQTIDGFYGMVDWSALEWLQVVAGARFERTDLSVTSDNLGTSAPANNGAIKQNDILPALSLVISLRTNLLLRPSWSQTVVRPTYREISDAELYDTALGRTYLGNPNLRMSSSENFDLRLEWYPRPGELVSLSVFKKTILNPIEQASQDVNNEFIYYNNYAKADVQGVEFEFRKSLDNYGRFLRDFSFGFNFTYIQSEVARTYEQYQNQLLYVGQSSRTRPMFDQPEFIANADLTWDHKSSGTALTVSGGIVGRRLTVVGLATPDEYEEPTPQLDVFLSQALGKHWKLKLSAKNLLDPAYETTQAWVSQTVKVRKYTKGITLGLSLNCEF
jgi:TonB-dependent receptor